MTPLDTCRKLIELGEKAERYKPVTAADGTVYKMAWEPALTDIETGKTIHRKVDSDQMQNEFVTFSRNHGPQIAKALIVAMEALDTIESMARIETTEECHRVRVAMDMIKELFSSGEMK